MALSLALSLTLSLDLSLTAHYPGSRGSCWVLVAVLVEVVEVAGLWWRVEVVEEVVWSSERSSNNRVILHVSRFINLFCTMAFSFC